MFDCAHDQPDFLLGTHLFHCVLTIFSSKRETAARKAAAMKAREEKKAAAMEAREEKKTAAIKAREEKKAAAMEAREEKKTAAIQAWEETKAAASTVQNVSHHMAFLTAEANCQNLHSYVTSDGPSSGTRFFAQLVLQCPGGKASACALEAALCAIGTRSVNVRPSDRTSAVA